MDSPHTQHKPVKERYNPALVRSSMTKYRNKPTVVDGIRFDSLKESRRYQELKLLEKAGEILDLELQPRFKFPIWNGLVGSEFENLRYPSGREVVYVADFEYREKTKFNHPALNREFKFTRIVEDCKGFPTPVFKLKAALMKAVHGIEVKIT